MPPLVEVTFFKNACSNIVSLGAANTADGNIWLCSAKEDVNVFGKLMPVMVTTLFVPPPKLLIAIFTLEPYSVCKLVVTAATLKLYVKRASKVS